MSDFSRGDGDWKALEGGLLGPVRFDGYAKFIGIQQSAIADKSKNAAAYFVAPVRFLGDQRSSYNHALRFKLKIGAVAGAEGSAVVRPSVEDIIIEGGGDATPIRISLAITEQNNPMPSGELQDYVFRLHENSEFGWTPSLRPKDFMAVLSNIKAIRIRGTYGVAGSSGFIDEVHLDTAELRGTGPPANWIERCTCPVGYEGQFCERCQPGYHHEANGGPFARCVPCNCNGHSDYCDIESGRCECSHNTDGHNCENCARGYYGDAIVGTPDDCQQCPCPLVEETPGGQLRVGACFEIAGDPASPICTECPEGRDGTRCEQCADGYFGDPDGLKGPARACRKCDCNGNVDPNAIGNCDRVSGECLRCVDDTAGFRCERCKSGFFGNATAVRKPREPQNCQPCQCYPPGTHLDQDQALPVCDSYTGKCSCKPNVIGHDCDRCKDGYFRIDSNMGCDPCNCDPVGSINGTCNVYSGQCFCRPGVTGMRCDMCEPYHYGFSIQGCTDCDCDPTGSTDLQCDELTGQCPCRHKVEGRKCDRCMENTQTRDISGGGEKVCEPCDDCYDLVQTAVNQHRANLEALDRLLQQIAENPEPVGDEFEVQLRRLQVRVVTMVADARISSQNEEGGTLRDRLEDLAVKVQEVISIVLNADNQLDVAAQDGRQAADNVAKAEQVINRAREALKAAKGQMDTKGREALRKAQERSKKFGEGSEKMSQIASSARQLSEQQNEDANEISSIAKQAFDLSHDAYQLAYSAMEEQVHNANKIDTLKFKLNEVESKLVTVEKLSSNTLTKATDAYQEALNIYQQVFNLDVPVLDTARLEEQAKKITQDARRIKEDAARLVGEHEVLVRETQDRRAVLQDLLNRASAQQQDVDSRLADMNKHRAKALEAVEIGNTVLKDAMETLETLKDFENRVNSNKDAAEQSLKEIDSIAATIQEAAEKTEQAGRHLNDAESNSHLAFDMARTSKGIAEKASDKAKAIVKESAETREAAQQLRSASESLKQKLTETEAVVGTKNLTATNDAKMANEALKEANQAQTQAQEASTKVAQAKKELEEIAAILQTVEEPGKICSAYWNIQYVSFSTVKANVFVFVVKNLFCLFCVLLFLFWKIYFYFFQRKRLLLCTE